MSSETKSAKTEWAVGKTVMVQVEMEEVTLAPSTTEAGVKGDSSCPTSLPSSYFGQYVWEERRGLLEAHCLFLWL